MELPFLACSVQTAPLLEDAGILKVQHDALPSQQDKDTRSLPVMAQREVWGTRAHNLLRSIEMRS